MFIKSLIIDGFKSYGKCTELRDFDPEFNAITGLNGTGKSNILDAICFVLGISTNCIRASSMQEVIYKSGLSGVTTATVSIYFDNKDKSRSVPHYSHNDEIVITRKVIEMGSKSVYQINGITVPVKKIRAFFNSIQMNVNNPHFIIMQGKINKVLNMKPVEILSLIEEIVGYKLYESKKESLEMTVKKKELDLKAIQDVVNEMIVPTIKFIDKEKQMLNEYNIIRDQLKKKRQKLDSWNYINLHISLKKKSQDLQSLIDSQQDKSNFIYVTEERIKGIKLQITENKKALKKKENGKKLIQFKAKVDKTIKVKNDVEFKVNNHKNYINSEREKLADLEKQVEISKKDLKVKKNEKEDLYKMNTEFIKDNKKNMDELDTIDKKIRLLNSGNIFDDEDSIVQESISKFNLEVQNQQIKNKQSTIKIDALRKNLKEHLTGMKEAQNIHNKQIALLTTKEKEYERIKNEYIKTNEELSSYDNLKSSRDSLLREIRNFSNKLELFESNNSSLYFRYNNPRPNFDRHKVHGLICHLIKPIDFKFELALTTLAGNKLYFVVVEDDSTVKDILETNSFPKRTHFIPLNKIISESLPQSVIRIAQQIGGADQVFPAMSLISYDKKHLKAIQWVFGQAFICTTAEIAEKVSFDSRVNKHCFTLEGDHFNPVGSLTGGVNTERLVLSLIASQNEIASQLEAKKVEFSKIDNKLAVTANLSNKVAELQNQQITVENELEKVKSDLYLGKPHQQITEVNNIKQQITELEKTLAEGKLNEKQLLAKIKDLNIKLKATGNILKQQLSDAENTRKNVLTKLKENKTEYDKKTNNHNKLELEIKYILNRIEEEENELTNLKTKIRNHEKNLITYISELEEATINYENANKEYKCENETVTNKINEINELNNNIKILDAEIGTKRIELLRIDVERRTSLKMLEDLQNTFDDIKKRLSHKQRKIASKMDFTDFKTGECEQSVNDLQVRYDHLSKTVNPGKMNDSYKHIQEYKKLQKKMRAVENDKKRILSIIKGLEKDKSIHLQSALHRVNVEFEKIFSSILPGTQACLRQVDPDDITVGLEIGIAFNGLWVNSLEELSGGQRSLISLSLVLAMLVFNPAPFYILDEVDAALDSSHTQNIGNMLMQHFKQSQFIVVSLKDGMFSNANVLFRTEFVDGCSVVTRTTKEI